MFDTEYKPGAQTIYQEYSLRQGWNSIKNAKDEEYMDYIDESWETYQSIFELEWARVNFPPSMTWDYFDNFLRVYTFHQSKIASISSKDGFSADWYSPESTKKMLAKISANVPNGIPVNPTIKEVFGYYSLVAQAVILTH